MPRAIRVAGLVALTLTLVNCDSTLHIHGAVYEWTTAPAGSQSHAFVDDLPPMTSEFRPLPGAQVTLFPDHEVRRQSAVADESGRYSISQIMGGLGRPDFDIDLKVTKPGFNSVEVTYHFYGDWKHMAVFVLSPDDSRYPASR